MSERIKILRKLRGLTQEELSRASSIPTSYISQMERGERHNPYEVEKILKALDVDLECQYSQKVFEDERYRLIGQRLTTEGKEVINNLGELILNREPNPTTDE